MISDFIVQILTAFHEATPPANVVSAFEQVGICSRSTGEDPYMVLRETYVDPARAREVVRELGLFRDLRKIEHAHHQLKISKMNNALQRANGGGDGGREASNHQTRKWRLSLHPLRPLLHSAPLRHPRSPSWRHPPSSGRVCSAFPSSHRTHTPTLITNH